MSSTGDSTVIPIPAADLRVGMYVHKLGSSWLNHPFLRGSFLLTDPQDISRIVEAGIEQVWIDPARESPAAQQAAAQAAPAEEAPADASPEGSATATRPPRARGEAPRSMQADIDRARKLVQAAKAPVMAMFRDIRLGKAIDPQSTVALVDEISASVGRNASAILSVARLKTHDDYTYLHSVAVCALMLSLARQLGLEEKQARLAGQGGLMHDLGKAFVPLEVLNKPGKLTDAEFEIIKQHPAGGAAVLRDAGAVVEVQDIALHHHEKFDGSGYPHGLKAEDISLLARMGAVCDVYDAVTSQRVYKKPWDPAHTMRIMARWTGHFDARVFNAFVKSVGIYPVGSLVRLGSQRLAVVVEPGAESLLAPKVRAFFSLRSNEPIEALLIDLGARGCRDSIVGPEDNDKWGFQHLDDLWQ